MKMNRINQIMGLVFIGFGILLYILTPICVTAVSSSYNGMVPTSFPYFVAGFTIFIGLLQFIESTIAIKKNDESDVMEVREWNREKRVLFIFVLLIVYTALCGVVGFFLASVAFSCAFLAVLGEKKWWEYLLVTVLCFLVFYCFRYLLYINLPRLGIWII